MRSSRQLIVWTAPGAHCLQQCGPLAAEATALELLQRSDARSSDSHVQDGFRPVVFKVESLAGAEE